MADEFQSGEYDVFFMDYLQALQWTGIDGQANVMVKLAESVSPSDMQIERVQQAFLGTILTSGYYPTHILQDYKNVFIDQIGRWPTKTKCFLFFMLCICLIKRHTVGL